MTVFFYVLNHKIKIVLLKDSCELTLQNLLSENGCR